jgi:hypothetical protein
MQRIVYISGLSHSGSTLLALMLGGHSHLIGLGEIGQVIKPGPMGLEKSRQSVCSCGYKMDKCIFWSKVYSALKHKDNESFEERYKIVLETFYEVFGQDVVPLDSSKKNKPLRLLNNNLKLDMKVLYIIKDVRSFTVSYIDNIRNKEKYRSLSYIKKLPIHIFWQWYSGNKKKQRLFRNLNSQVFQIGYEELCLYPNIMIQKICDFLEVSVIPSMSTLNISENHIIRGNRMRHQKDKFEVRYDHRWFMRNEWIMPSLLFPKIMRYNAREVYINKTDLIWKQ